MVNRDPITRWWERASGITRMYLKKEERTLADATAQLPTVRSWGFDAVEIFGPYHGGTEYSGLDAYNFMHPKIGQALGSELHRAY